MEVTKVTTVAARGEAEAEYNVVGFSVSMSELAGSVPTAKGKLQSHIADLDTALTELMSRLKLEFVKNSLRSSSQVNEKYEYNQDTRQQEFRGFEVTYSVSFEIDEMSRVNEVYDALTSLTKVRVGQPSFRLKDNTRERLNKKALKHAFEKVQARFEMECVVLGLRADDYEVGTWEVDYSDTQRTPKVRIAQAYAFGAASAGGGALESGGSNRGADDFAEGASIESALGSGSGGAINFVAGMAQVTVNLEVSYQSRPTPVADRIARIVKDSTVSKENSNHV